MTTFDLIQLLCWLLTVWLSLVNLRSHNDLNEQIRQSKVREFGLKQELARAIATNRQVKIVESTRYVRGD